MGVALISYADRLTQQSEGRSDYKRREIKRQQRRYDGKRREQPLKPFVAVDGEGGTCVWNEYHAYFLLTAGDASILPADGNVRLTTAECLAFLADLPDAAIYVSYFFDYDVTKILEDLPFGKLKRLMRPGLRARRDGGVFPVTYGEFEVDYLPRKEFKVRRVGTSHWTVINDVGSFFQCRFVDAISKWKIGSESDWDTIEAGKQKRAKHAVLTAQPLTTWPTLGEIQSYNADEITLLQDLMEKFRAACMAVGYIPAKWQGPGLLAEAMFRTHGVLPSKDLRVLNDEKYGGLMDFARSAFYGGRPELGVVGPVTRPVYQWDINSAYPRAMLEVPCLEHGSWTYVKNPRDWELDRYAICYGTFDRRSGKRHGTRYYGLPVRGKTGTIYYPGAGKGWYWKFEIDASIHQKFRVESAWVYGRHCHCKPLAFVADAYQQRLTLGKDDAGVVLKLALNSLYGKTCQSIGRPKYANPIWASFITAFCRTMIQEFIHSSPTCKEHGLCGQDVYMIATDSVCTSRERDDVLESKELGGWSREVHADGIFFIQPGVYFGSSGKAAKTRGVPRAAMEEKEAEFRAAYDRMVASGDLKMGVVHVPQTMFVGIRYALHRHNTKLLGQWIEFKERGTEGKAISFDWSSKRLERFALPPIGRICPYLQTMPKYGSIDTETLPYDKDIGGIRYRRTMEAMHMEAQPDWVDMSGLGGDDG